MDAAAANAEMNRVVAGQTIPKEFLKTVEAHGDLVALRWKDPDGGDAWYEMTFREYADAVARAATGLAAQGLGQGDRLMLMIRNMPEFHVLDTAALFLGATPVSIYNSSSPEEIQFLAEHAEAEIAILEDDSFLERMLKVRGELPELQKIFVIEPPDGPLPEGVFPASELLAHGEAVIRAGAAWEAGTDWHRARPALGGS